MYEWQSWRTLVPLLLGILGLMGFVVYSVYLSPEPLIRRSLFNSSTAIIAYFGTLVHGIIVWSLLYYMPLYFEVAKDYSPVTSGVALFPFTFTIAPAAVMVGIVITKTGRYRPSIVSVSLVKLRRIDTNIYEVDWMVFDNFRDGPFDLSKAIDKYTLVDIPLFSRRLWYRYAVFSSRVCSSSFIFQRRPAIRWSNLLILQSFWSNPRCRCLWRDISEHF